MITVLAPVDLLLLFFRGMLHSNPMDYAWGANGLDAIITQVSEINVVSVTCLMEP